MILVDPLNPTAQAHHCKLMSRLDAQKLSDNVHVVIGGDGFMLRTVSEYGFEPCYVGLNAGRIGFLLNDVTDWDAAATTLLNGTWTEHSFGVLQAELRLADGSTHITHAVNDVALERSTGQTAHLTVSIDGKLCFQD